MKNFEKDISKTALLLEDACQKLSEEVSRLRTIAQRTQVGHRPVTSYSDLHTMAANVSRLGSKLDTLVMLEYDQQEKKAG